MSNVDWLITQDVNGTFLCGWLNNNPVIDTSLQTLVTVSLFTDKRIADSDVLPSFFDTTQIYQGGFWGDDYPSDGTAPGVQVQPHGSLLWTLKNAKQIDETLSLAITYINDALQWLIDTSRASAIDTTAWWRTDSFLESFIQITLPDGSQITNQFLVNA